MWWGKETVLEGDILYENFDALKAEKASGNNFSSYEDFKFIGQSYVIWDIINGRIDLGMKSGGDAITLKGLGNEITDAGMGRIYAEEIHDGIAWLEFDVRLFGSDTFFQMKVKSIFTINQIQVMNLYG